MNLSRRRPHFGGTDRIWTECDSFVEWRRGTGDPNRLKKGLRRVYVGNHQTSFSTQTANGPGFFENVPTKDFIKVKTLV